MALVVKRTSPRTICFDWGNPKRFAQDVQIITIIGIYMTARPVLPNPIFYAHITDCASPDLKGIIAEIKVILVDDDDSTICYLISGKERRYWSNKAIKEFWHTSREEAYASEPYLEDL